MTIRIAIIQGQPDPRGNHFCNTLGEAYADAAESAGHEVRRIDVARLDFPLLRDKDDWDKGSPPDSIREAQLTIGWAQHLVIIYPLWLGSIPALLKGFLEQALRPGFAFSRAGDGKPWRKLLAGRTARIVVTMGMPAFVYRWYFGAHSLKSLERNILKFCGIGPIRESLVGTVEAANGAAREKWLAKMRALGAQGR